MPELESQNVSYGLKFDELLNSSTVQVYFVHV